MSLSDVTNQHYRAHVDDWKLARDFYSLSHLESYLRQGKYEPEGPYAVRVRRRFAHDHTSNLVSQISDPLLLRVDEVERQLGPVPRSYMDAAGPEGESHNLLMKRLGDYLLLYGEAWLQVVPGGGTAVLRVLSPITVPRWNLQAEEPKVLTLGQRPQSDDGFLSEEKTQKTYTLHEPRGWTTYAEDKETGDPVQIDAGVYSPTDYEAFFVDQSGAPTPPLVRVQMPWDAIFGVAVARVHRAIFQTRNELHGRFSQINTNGRVVTKGLGTDDEVELEHSLKRGKNLLHLHESADVEEFPVPVEGIKETQQELKDLKDDLYETAYQTLDGATSNASATEAVVKNESKAAAVATLASTIQSAEAAALNLVAQSVDIVSYGGPNPQDAGITSDWTSIEWEDASVTLQAGRATSGQAA
jgi:hypothetical protein